MKLTKKYLTICLLLALPSAIFANQNVNSSPQAIASQPSSIALTSLPHGNITAPSTVSIANCDDIAHSDHAAHQGARNWLKTMQIKQILNKAQQNGKLTYVMSKLNNMQLPKSLALIPVIESQYTSGAVSNKGANGIWQLMPVTAKRFGLTNNQRYQLAPSTDAALKYFKTLHQKFGNWELAIAAYNAGEGRIQHALDKSPGVTNVQQLNLPQETKQYVQRFYMLEDYIAQNGDQTSISA